MPSCAAVALFLIWYFSNIVAYILISAVLAIIGKPMVDSLLKCACVADIYPVGLPPLFTLATIWTVAVLFVTFFVPLGFQ